MNAEQKKTMSASKGEIPATKSTPIYIKVVDHLRRCIKEGTLIERVLLTESNVSTLLGVSRTPARLALLHLANEHLIEKRAPRGYQVGNQNQGDVRKLTPEMLQLPSGNDFLHPIKEWETIYEKIESEIIRLSILSGWKIKALAVAKTYNCSRNAVQEILSRLEVRGLVSRRYQSRWMIIPLDDNRLNNIFDVRSWLEPNLLAQAAPRIPQKVLHHVIERHDYALKRFPQVTSSELNRLELDMHERLMQFADNGIAMVALRSTKAGLISSKHVVASQEVPLGDDDPFIEEHLAILEAIDRNNIDEGRLRMQAHLLKSREKVINRLKQFRLAGQANPDKFIKPWATELTCRKRSN